MQGFSRKGWAEITDERCDVCGAAEIVTTCTGCSDYLCERCVTPTIRGPFCSVECIAAVGG